MKAMQPSAAADEIANLREEIIAEIGHYYADRHSFCSRSGLRELVGQRVLQARALEVAWNALENAGGVT